MLLAVSAVILTLILVVGIHEGGHALVARFFKVNIKKISIGFGRPLVQWQTQNGCEWVWAIWPLGGYVQLLNSRIKPVEPEEFSLCFDKKPVWIRVLILLAGAVANLVTAWLAFVFVFYLGLNYKSPQIESVQENSVASRAGLAAGDQLISIDGRATSSWQEVGMELVILWGNKEVKATINRSNTNELKEITLNLSQITFNGQEQSLLSSLGIKPNLMVVNNLIQAPSFLAAIKKSNDTIVHMFYFFMMILKQLCVGAIPFAVLLGPIGIFAASLISLKQGIVVFMFFIANFSLAVALVNLFPIPGLDGGSIFYCVIEKIRGKPISVAMEVLLHQLMFIIFCLLLVHLVINDLGRVIH